ncbi:MAG TPA: hypothetical protein PK693_08420 [Halothiobacillus sp.]|jgi:hypothetical protein|nr:hypothetical protein [Halothiobacillus sp.]
MGIAFNFNNDERTIITKRLNNYLSKIQEFVDEITRSSDGIAFSFSRDRLNNLKLTKHKPLANYFDQVNQMLDEHSRDLIFSPEVNLFFHSCVKYQWPYDFNIQPTDLYFNQKTMGEKFNELIALIKQGLASADYKREVSNREWNQKRNHQSAMAYVDGWFACYARLLVIRVDFGYPYDRGCGCDGQHETLRIAAGYGSV